MLRTVIRLYLLESFLFSLTCVGCWLALVSFELGACCHSMMIVLYFLAGTKKAAKLKCAQNALASVEAGEITPTKVR